MSKDRGERLRSKLNHRQIKFCHEFLVDLNQTAAYLRAGYSGAGSARANAARLIATDNIQQYIQYLKSQQEERTGVTADRVLEEYARIAFSKITDAMSFDEDGVVLKPSKSLRDEVVAAIESVSAEQGKQGGVKFTIKMHSKISALDALAKHLGLQNDLNSAWRTLERYGFERRETDRGYELIDTYRDGSSESNESVEPEDDSDA